ncbi:MAG: choice-of-anchor J domain-containing protein [Muribaculaceae bacterium]|nr:choice-of-anchor J domain-containing protein [Muribaculaceae bacterium]
MNKHLLLIAATALASLTAGAESPRSIAATGSGMRQIIRVAPQVAQVTDPASAPMKAPDNAVEVPFTHQLGKDSPVVDLVKNHYTVINANGDNRQWQVATVNSYSACMAPNAADIDANDDWLITVPIHMPAGDYTVSFDLGYLSGTAVTLGVMLGTAPTVEGMIAEIAPETVYTTKDQTTYSYPCAIPEDGYYYIGFHCTTTKAQKSAVKLFNVDVKAGAVVQVDPPAAGELSWELAPKGELKATVKYTAPTKTKSGADLTEISKVEITSRWGVDKFTYTDVTPGQTIVIEDVEMYQGINNRFTGVAYVGDTAGDMVEYKSIFCGKDTPLAPTNVRLQPTADYTGAILTWDAVGNVGENGGYVDPEAVTYYIFDAFGSYYDPAVAETPETTVTLTYPDLQGQDFMAYQVTAGYGENYSLDCSSNIVVVGQPAALPFSESFADGYYEGVWCLDPATSYNGQQYGTVNDDYFASLIDPEDPDAPTPLTSFDGDNGFLYWLPMEKNVMFGLMSVRADISTAVNPVLEFRYQGQGSTIDIFVAAGDGQLQLVKSIDLQAEPANGWTLARLPLSEYKSAGAVSFEIRLTATHNDDDHTWSVPVDNIVVRDLVDTDVRIVSSASSAAKTSPAKSLDFNAHIQNTGLNAADLTAQLYIGDVKVDQQTLGNVEADAFADTRLTYAVPVNAPETLNARLVVTAAGESTSAVKEATFEIPVEYAPYPGITDLAAQPDDAGETVTLTWSAPVIAEPQPTTVFEDFENDSYTPMSINGCGGWTVHDGDGARTINVFYETDNPYQTAPMAFQLFNRTIAKVPSQYWIDAQPHSGETYMLAPTAYYDDNDNYLISPELSGNAQTVTFWAKSFSVAWPEYIEVRYSTGGNTVADFPVGNTVEIANYSEDGVPEVWTLFSVELPEGAKYFTIHHTGYYTCALFVDDVTFEGMPDIPADLAVTGYHILRDDNQLTDRPVNATEYVDQLPESAAGQHDYTYTVVPVYNHGIARGENVTVSVSRSGIETIAIDSVDAADTFYTLQGIRVTAANLTPGLYIRLRGTKSAKVLLR